MEAYLDFGRVSAERLSFFLSGVVLAYHYIFIVLYDDCRHGKI